MTHFTFLVLLAISSSAQSTKPGPSGPSVPFVDAQNAPASAPSTDASAALATPAAPPVEPWRGRLADGLAEVRRLVEANEAEPARALCERLVAPTPILAWKEESLARPGWRRTLARAVEPALDLFGAEALSAPARAEVRYASGLASVAGADALAAENAFAGAQALAGPGELRLASGYQVATVALFEAEALRAEIPELQQQNGQGGAPNVNQLAQGATQGMPNQPDPLQVARAAYLRARAKFAERLKADWRDADTRANTELVMKRLKELDELEKKREEQKQEEQENKDPEQQEDSKDPQKQKDPKEQESQNQEQKPEDKPEPEEPKPDETKPEDQKPEEKKEGEAPKPGEERQLSKEEMQRLFDLLEQREQQWKKLQKQLQQARRAKVKKDW